MKRVIIASKTNDFIYVILRNGEPIAKGSYDAIYKKANNMSIPVDIKKFAKSEFNSYFKMAKDARMPNPLKFAMNRYINDNRDEYRAINSSTNIEDNSIYNLAKRLVKFSQDYDWYDYKDSLEIGETEEDAIESMVDSLSTKKGVQSILNTLNEILSDDSEVDKAAVEKLIDDISITIKSNVSSATILASDSSHSIYMDVYYKLEEELNTKNTKIGQKAFDVLDREGIADIIADGKLFWFEYYSRGNDCPQSVYDFLKRYIKRKFGYEYAHDYLYRTNPKYRAMYNRE